MNPRQNAVYLLGTLAIALVICIILLHAYVVRTDQLHQACQAGRAGLDSLSDSLYLLHAPGCR